MAEKLKGSERRESNQIKY